MDQENARQPSLTPAQQLRMGKGLFFFLKKKKKNLMEARGKIGYIKALRKIKAGEEILADRNSDEKVDFIVPAIIGMEDAREKAKPKRKLIRPANVRGCVGRGY